MIIMKKIQEILIYLCTLKYTNFIYAILTGFQLKYTIFKKFLMMLLQRPRIFLFKIEYYNQESHMKSQVKVRDIGFFIFWACTCNVQKMCNHEEEKK